VVACVGVVHNKHRRSQELGRPGKILKLKFEGQWGAALAVARYCKQVRVCKNYLDTATGP
jgi:hypothetical protein